MIMSADKFFTFFLFPSIENTVVENQRKSLKNIASEASYVYILLEQKCIKNGKNSQFGEFLKTVLPDLSILMGQN